MQPLITTIKIPTPSFRIGYAHRLMSIGSCFSENIGRYFERAKFHITINPFGQQYNPYSVAQAIDRLCSARPFAENELVQHDELYHSYAHHGSYSRPTATETLAHINRELATCSDVLLNCDVLFLTFGTAHVFRLKSTGEIVSNCHKLSGSFFDLEMLKSGEIVHHLQRVIVQLRQRNPTVKIVFTISPVRYFAFGHYENSVSKAHLFTAVDELLKTVSDSYYFPAYEIVMDELRDYRFFAEDMLHPNYQATQYVWEKVAQTFFEKDTWQLLQEVNQLTQAARHRPRNPHSQAHKKFVANQLQKIQQLEEKYGFDFDEERRYLYGNIR